MKLKPNPNITPVFMTWQLTPLIYYVFIIYQILMTNSKFYYLLLLGMIIGEFINHSLKNIIGYAWRDKYPQIVRRPSCKYACNYIGLQSITCSYWGMPSGHAQATLLFVTMIYLYLKRNNQLTTINTTILLLILLVVPLSRVYYKCHSFAQIIVGGMIGMFIGFILFKIYML